MLKINIAEEKVAAYERVFRRSPQLTSLQAGWQGIYFAYDFMPPGETPEVISTQNGIAIFTNTGKSQVAERSLNGQFRCEQVADGNMVIVPAHTSCQSRWFDYGGVIFFSVESSVIAHAVHEVGNSDRIELLPQFATADPFVYQAAVALKSVLEQEGSASRLYGEAISNALIVHTIQHYSNRRPLLQTYENGLSHYRLRHVIEYIQAHLEQDLSLNELAAIAQMSPHYFSQLFKQSTGVTPHQFVIRARVERARELLMTRKWSIAEVARMVGFVDQSHLHRHCKRLLGVTPRMIQNQA